MVFSYGSGSTASVYSFIGRDTSTSSFSLQRIQEVVRIFERLEARKQCSVEEFRSKMLPQALFLPRYYSLRTLIAILFSCIFFYFAKHNLNPYTNDNSAALDMRASMYGKASATPVGSIDNIESGSYYLHSINDKYHRKYVLK